MSRYSYIFALLLLSLVSCSKDDEPKSKIPANAVYDFVTFVDVTPSGSMFEMRKVDDSPLIIYDAPIDITKTKDKLKAGDRIIICYTPEEGRQVYQSGRINLYGYGLMSNTEQGVLSGKAAEYNNWQTGPFDIESIWRTGQYINMQTNIYGFKALNPEKFVLVIDEATIDNQIPEAYIIYKQKDGNDGANAYGVNASFDISSVWSLPTCQGIAINYPTLNGKQQNIFLKQQ